MNTIKTVKPFKSALAAKQAMTKAERAMVDADVAERATRHERCLNCESETLTAAHRQAEAAYHAARDYAQAVYDQTKAQKFCVSSWDLIAANLD